MSAMKIRLTEIIYILRFPRRVPHPFAYFANGWESTNPNEPFSTTHRTPTYSSASRLLIFLSSRSISSFFCVSIATSA